MRTVRFHGRGGQGAKTASRIVGTAAFLEGRQGRLHSRFYEAERCGLVVIHTYIPNLQPVEDYLKL
jgi:pyruvate ferredoxin oxidoreductase gamma subunit